jgi:deoxyribodipyrimidine photo-lyase
MAAVGIVWFRRDLRVADNPALVRALEDADFLVPVFIHAPEEEAPWAPGAASRWWLHHSLSALQDQLRRQRSELIIRRGPSAEALLALAKATGARTVYWNRLYEPAARQRDSRIKHILRDAGIRAESFNGALLAEPWEVLGSNGPYKVFTPYWKACLRRHTPADPLPAPRSLRPPPGWPDGEPLAALGLLPRIRWYTGLAGAWTPGLQGAGGELRRFLGKALDDYPRQRDYPAVAGTSRLSPHLHFGELSARQVWHDVRAAGGGEHGAEAYLRQLGWRDFGHQLLYHFPRTTDQPFREDFAEFPWRQQDEPLYRAWIHGQTGIPLVDAGMRELWATGFVHNRVRMNVASFLTKNARLHWLSGARWFWDTLVDADLANNTLGWQWTAGCGADAAPYFRIFNPVRQGERFDPHGTYVKRWIPELKRVPDRYVHAPWSAPPDVLSDAGIELARDYPYPVLDLKQTRAQALEAYQQFRNR